MPLATNGHFEKNIPFFKHSKCAAEAAKKGSPFFDLYSLDPTILNEPELQPKKTLSLKGTMGDLRSGGHKTEKKKFFFRFFLCLLTKALQAWENEAKHLFCFHDRDRR